MTSENFCYWLQGYFEIERPTHMGQWQVECLRRHVALVEACNKQSPPRYDSPSTTFVTNLSALLSFVAVTELEEGTVKALQQRLNEVFKHEVDGPDPTGELQAIHDGTHELTPAEIGALPYWDPRGPNYDPRARC